MYALLIREPLNQLPDVIFYLLASVSPIQVFSCLYLKYSVQLSLHVGSLSTIASLAVEALCLALCYNMYTCTNYSYKVALYFNLYTLHCEHMPLYY